MRRYHNLFCATTVQISKSFGWKQYGKLDLVFVCTLRDAEGFKNRSFIWKLVITWYVW